ncbi:MAG: outer membrane beta-barrel family protein [Muribaculum sp.]|nr:outer membrane beta-barrel family protein [Muribaculum sp.]
MEAKDVIITVMLCCCATAAIAQQQQDSIRIQELNEVVVQSQMQRTSVTSSTFIPNKKQKSSAQNAIDLLQQLAIPQITINLVDNAVTTLSGQNVAIYINYLPASSHEIEGLLTADVRRVEYLDFPTDPRFNGSEHVVNFIMQRYEYGGYTKLTLNENFLVGLSNRASVYSKFAYKSMVYDLYAGTSNHDNKHVGTSYISKYTLTGNEGVEQEVTRSEIFDNAHFKYNQYPVTFRAVYDSDRIQISNTIGFTFDQSPLAETNGSLSFSQGAASNYSYTRNEPYTTRWVSWQGGYYFILPRNFQLNLNPSANYSHTNYNYTYSSTLPGDEIIENVSRENAWQVRGSASLYKIFSQKQNVYLRTGGGTTRNEVAYMGSNPYDNSFTDSYAGATVGYNFSSRPWNVNADVALQWERNKINSTAVSEIYPIVNVSASYSPTNRHSLRAFFHLGANYPGASEKTPNILQVNELMYQTGNPDLKLSRQVNFNFQYNWMPRNNFSAALYAQYFGEYNLYVPVYTPYQDGHALLKSFISDGKYHKTSFGLSFNYKLLNNKLQLAAQPSVTLYRLTGYYDISKSPFAFNASVTYYLNNFYFQASYQTPMRTIQGNRAAYYKDRDFYQLLVGWSKSGWNIRLTAIDLFRSDWLGATQTINAPLYSETKLQGGNYYHRRLNLSVTYTFNYGKKVQQGNEVGEQSGAASAILK